MTKKRAKVLTMENKTLISDHFNTPGLNTLFSDKKLRLVELRNKVLKLNAMAETLDPYKEIPLETQDELKSLGVLVLDDPFAITNQLVVILEDTVEELHKLESELGA